MTLIDISREIGTCPTDRCPWCGISISRSKFIEIEGRIREEEQKRSQEAEGRLKENFQRQLTVEKQVAEKRATEAAVKQVAAMTANVTRLLKKSKKQWPAKHSFEKDLKRKRTKRQNA